MEIKYGMAFVKLLLGITYVKGWSVSGLSNYKNTIMINVIYPDNVR